jgi:hypothetical protein
MEEDGRDKDEVGSDGPFILVGSHPNLHLQGVFRYGSITFHTQLQPNTGRIRSILTHFDPATKHTHAKAVKPSFWVRICNKSVHAYVVAP